MIGFSVQEGRQACLSVKPDPPCFIINTPRNIVDDACLMKSFSKSDAWIGCYVLSESIH